MPGGRGHHHRGRGGRHSGRRGGGGAAAAASEPQQQPKAAPPSGAALLVDLRATDEFYASLAGQECPASDRDGGCGGATPMGIRKLEMSSWRQLGDLLAWFCQGLGADPLAELAFSPTLTKNQRASVHGTATAVGKGALGTASRGLGEQRCVVVMQRDRAERPVLDERQDHRAFWVWKWAGQAGLMGISRDEVGEMVAADALTPQLQEIWDTRSAQQRAVQQLCAAVGTGDLEATKALLAAHPEVLADRLFNVQSGVAPLQVAAGEGQLEALALLLAAPGADPEARDGHGWTALQVARRFEQSDAEGLLLRAGAADPDSHKWPGERAVTLTGDGPTRPAAAQQHQNGTTAKSAGAKAPPPPAAAPKPAVVDKAAVNADEEQEAAEGAVTEVAEAAAVSAVRSFTSALIVAQAAAEAAAEAAEGSGTAAEAAEAAAALSQECDAAVVAAAAGVVAAGEALDGGGDGDGAAAPDMLDDGASAMSVCGSDMTHVHSLNPADFARAASLSYAAPSPLPPAVSAVSSTSPSSIEGGGSEGSGPLEPAAAAEAEAKTKAPPAAAGARPAEAPTVPAAVAAAAAAPAAAGGSWSEQAASAASRARAQLEACLPPEWSAWVQENPGTVLAGAGAVAATLAAAALLLGKSGRH